MLERLGFIATPDRPGSSSAQFAIAVLVALLVAVGVALWLST